MIERNTTAAGEVGGSHIVSLGRPADGLLARLALIDQAERNLDLQYYLWASDAVGYLLLNRLLAAADRGVRVRILVDDLKLREPTRSVAALCQHPNLEIRLFNPWRHRSSRVAQAFEFIQRFQVLDRRMHNKLLVEDDRRAIFGGRNIAVEHFGLGKTFNLVDHDLLLTGDEAADLTHVFETYWESAVSATDAAFDASVSAGGLTATRAFISQELEKRTPILSPVLHEEDKWNHRSTLAAKPITKGAVRFAADAPDVSQESQHTQVLEALRKTVNTAQRDLVVATPFFVPSELDVEWYQRIIDRGVRIRVLTNSLASNQGTISNAGLKKQRLAMVKAGIELHELRTDAADKPEWETPTRVARYLGLHAKLYIVDHERVFLGSVNLDPRSKYINTEIGALIDHAEFAEEAADGVIRLMALDNAWRVEIGSDGRLRWHSSTGTLRRQPARGMGQRLADTVFGLLPIAKYT